MRRIEPIVGTDLRTTGRPEPTLDVSDIKRKPWPFLIIDIDYKTNLNDVIRQIDNTPVPFIFEARSDSIWIRTEAERDLFIIGMTFMWVYLADKYALDYVDDEAEADFEAEQALLIGD